MPYVALLHLHVQHARCQCWCAPGATAASPAAMCATDGKELALCCAVRGLGHAGADALPRLPCVALLHLRMHRARCKCAPGAMAASPAAMCATDGKELALCCASVTLSSVCESVAVVKGSGRSVGLCCHRRHMVKDHSHALMPALMSYPTSAGQMMQLVERSAAAWMNRILHTALPLPLVSGLRGRICGCVTHVRRQ
jgi:hypothetical protein